MHLKNRPKNKWYDFFRLNLVCTVAALSILNMWLPSSSFAQTGGAILIDPNETIRSDQGLPEETVEDIPAPSAGSADSESEEAVPVPPPLPPLQSETTHHFVKKDIAVLKAIDKITARVQELEIPAGQNKVFQDINVTVRACQVNAPQEISESASFVEVVENTPKGQTIPLFSGWMFATSPALSALDHPVYDIWVVGCK